MIHHRCDGSPPSFDQLLRSSRLPRLEALALLESASGQRREFLIAHGEQPVAAAPAARFEALAQARRSGQPLAYLLGQREFRSHRFAVSAATLIPRPETEALVEVALAVIAGRRAPAVIDLGTGSGIIAISLALARPDAYIWASDTSCDTLQIARANAQTHAATIRWRHGDWWQALAPEDGPFDLVVANPPYIAAADPHLNVGDLRFEPRLALTPGPLGTEALVAVAIGAKHWLKAAGWLVLEHGFDQGGSVRALLAGLDFEAITTSTDLGGQERVTRGQLKPSTRLNSGKRAAPAAAIV